VSSHDLLKLGIVVRHFTRVYVVASLIALEMSAAGGWMPTLLLDRL
jgi:hypothetical protein